MKNLSWFLIMAIAACVVTPVQPQETPPGSPGAPGTDGKAAKTVKPRQQVVKKLPDQYKSKDKDGDGQIGLYEWPKSDYATFRKLDRNGDGFLTAQELLAMTTFGKPKSKSAGASGGEKGAAPPATDSKESPAVVKTTDSTSAVSTGNPTSPVEKIFKVTDKDGDGSISEAEWKKSFLAKRKFEDAGITVTFPLSKEDFMRLYPAPAASTDK